MGAQVVKSTDSKRMRMDRDALENMLFGLFERQPAWPFMQLEKETNQPVPWLKVERRDPAVTAPLFPCPAVPLHDFEQRSPITCL